MRQRLIATLAIAAATILTAAACGPAKASPPKTESGVALFGTDGIMANSFGQAVTTPGELAGMSGTAPLTPLDTSFTSRLLQINSSLDDFNYADQAYDAVAIAGLAAQTAGTTDAATIAKYINGVTSLQKGGVECATVKDCLSDIARGQDIAYRSTSVTSGFTKAGEPSTATYGTQHFDAKNQIDDQRTEYVTTGSTAAAATAAPAAPASGAPSSGQPLKLGFLLPKTGPLGAAGKPIFAGAQLAVNDINAAGGILGQQIQVETEDDGTDVTKAVAGAKKLIGDGVNVIIGPAESGAVAAVMPLAIAAHVVVFSPSATSAALSTLDDQGLFFRTAPSDILQAQAVSDVMLRSGAQRVFIIARNDSYGTGLAHDVVASLTAGGLSSDNVMEQEYPVESGADAAGAYATIAQAVIAFRPTSVLLLGYDETAQVLEALVAAHVTLTTSN